MLQRREGLFVSEFVEVRLLDSICDMEREIAIRRLKMVSRPLDICKLYCLSRFSSQKWSDLMLPLPKSARNITCSV